MLKILFIAIIIVTLGILVWRTQAQASEVKEGQPAPTFTLPDSTGKKHALGDYAGQWVVLYFYPKDDTPGCTKEACEFRDNYVELTRMGAQVIGVSLDNAASHTRFSKKYSLPFPLLSDSGGQVASQYGSLWGLGPVKFAKRHTFIIDPDGTIARVYRHVDPKTHSGEVLRDLLELTSSQ